MKHRVGLYAICMLATFTSACSTVRGGPPRIAEIMQTDARLKSLQSAIEIDCLTIPNGAGSTGTARRNSIAMAYMLASDEVYNAFEAAMLEEARVGNFVATIASLGLATAGSVAGGNTARVLSAANTGVLGEREAFNKEFLFSLTVPALQNQMRASRAAIRTRIYERMQSGTDVWPTCLALQDLAAYEQAGTLVGALVGINETTAASKSVEEALAQKAVLRFKYDTGNAAEALRAYFNPDDDDLRAARIARGMNKAMIIANLSPPTGVTMNEYFGRVLSDPAFGAQQRALLLGVIATETDALARAPLIDVLKQ